VTVIRLQATCGADEKRIVDNNAAHDATPAKVYTETVTNGNIEARQRKILHFLATLQDGRWVLEERRVDKLRVKLFVEVRPRVGLLE